MQYHLLVHHRAHGDRYTPIQPLVSKLRHTCDGQSMSDSHLHHCRAIDSVGAVDLVVVGAVDLVVGAVDLIVDGVDVVIDHRVDGRPRHTSEAPQVRHPEAVTPHTYRYN